MIYIRIRGGRNMPKDENAVSYIEEFNRSHRRIKREEKDWYVMYLPRGLGMEDITEKEDRELMSIFTKAEEEMEIEFDMMVKDRFLGYFESLALVDILEYLPQKPAPIILENMDRGDRNAIKDIYNECIEAGYIKKTIRKQIRKYLDEAGYLKRGEYEISAEPEPEEKIGGKKAEKKAQRKREMEQTDIAEFLPQKPASVEFEILSPEDQETIIEICRKGLEAGYVKKTIRKQVRKILDEKKYFERIRESADAKQAPVTKSKKEKADEPKGSKGEKEQAEPKGKEKKGVKAEKEKKEEAKGKEKKGVKAEKEKKTVKGEKGKKTEAKGKKKATTEKGSGKDAKSSDNLEILDFLPQKPKPFNLSSLRKKDKEHIQSIYREGLAENHVKKTIRKHIRSFINELEYLKADSAKGKGKRSVPPPKKLDSKDKKGSKPGDLKKEKAGSQKKKQTGIAKKGKKPVEPDLSTYLPQKPTPMNPKKLKKADLKYIQEMCQKGVEEGYIPKTIRKQVRKYLVEKGYIK